MDYGMMATAGVGLVVGVGVGAGIVGIFAAAKVADANSEAERWRRLWERENNRIAAFREKASKIMLPVRGEKGQVKGTESVKTRINGWLCLEGREYDTL